MNQNNCSAYQEHLAYPKFRHAFQKWRINLYLVATRVISEDEEVFVDYNYNTVAELVQKADTECKGASWILAKIIKNNYWIQHKLLEDGSLKI